MGLFDVWQPAQESIQANTEVTGSQNKIMQKNKQKKNWEGALNWNDVVIFRWYRVL